MPRRTESIRHDLRNAVTALEYGCVLLAKTVPPQEDRSALHLLEEMRARLREMRVLVDELCEREALGSAEQREYG